MTLKQAFTEWAAIPENTALAARSRSAVNLVLLKKHGDNDVRRFTEFAVRVLMQECKEPKSMKTQAASILVHVLNYAAKKGVCQKPEFDYNIASAGEDRPTKESTSKLTETKKSNSPRKPDKSKGSRKPETEKKSPAAAASEVVGGEASGEKSPEPPSGRDQSGRFIKGRKTWNTGKVGYFGGGRKPVPVCQLHPETLEVVARFDDMAAAHRETCVYNIHRAVRDRKMSGGYYWCRQGEEEGFKPGYVKGPKKQAWSRKKGAKKTPVQSSTSVPGPEKPATDKSVLESGGARYRITTGASTTRAALSDFSDAELRTELERRGWYGTLYQRLEFLANRQSNE